MRKVIVVLALSMLGLLLVRRPSFAADDTTVAREHAQKGKAFVDLGKYPEAATEYEAAYAAKPDPALLLNLAQTYRLAGNTDKALFFYRKYLQHVPKSPYRADIEEKIAALEAQGKSASASAGNTATSPPRETPAQPGAATTNPVYTPPPSTPTAPPVVAPPPGETAPGSATEPAAPVGTGPYGAQPAGTAAGGPASSPAPAAAPAAANHGQKLKLAGFITGGVGVLSFLAAAIYGSQAKDAAKNVEKAAGDGGVYDKPLQDQDARGRTAQSRATGAIVLGFAALAGGGVLYYLGTRHDAQGDGERAPASVAILPAASANELGAAVRVTF